MITLWVEGYAATGGHGNARCLGTWPGETYEEAVLNWKAAEWSDRKWGSFKQEKDGKYSVWRCRIFDNEKDARGSFG